MDDFGSSRTLTDEQSGRALDLAVHGLERSRPELSARHVPNARHGVLLAILGAVAGLLGWRAPAAATVAFAVLLLVGFLGNALFRAILVWVGADDARDPAPAARSDDPALPLYSIIVPLYREAEIVSALIAALRKLDYPAERLDILLVAEADDGSTLAALHAAVLPACFRIVEVPVALPRTKPKAANYALAFARGGLTVIYDAEDRPEADQLLKAVAAFRHAPPSVACLQARLNFFNAEECWLSRMFALDYALWFDFLLPGLDRLKIPMPLGGTSNHFRTETLRAIGGWDPYNVTEDADLGVRLAALGLRVETLDSTTFEEATVELGNWLRQRTRWMKGYMQTWLVHMRNPYRLMRHAGPGGFAGFQLFVAGTFVTALLNPLLWALFVFSRWDGGWGASFATLPIAEIAGAGLFFGNALFAYLAMLAPYRRGWLELAPFGLTAPLYWLLISAAAYRALWHLVRRPWQWEKTQHGRSRFCSPVGGAP